MFQSARELYLFALLGIVIMGVAGVKLYAKTSSNFPRPSTAKWTVEYGFYTIVDGESTKIVLAEETYNQKPEVHGRSILVGGETGTIAIIPQNNLTVTVRRK